MRSEPVDAGRKAERSGEQLGASEVARRDFLRRTGIGLAAVAASTVVEGPAWFGPMAGAGSAGRFGSGLLGAGKSASANEDAKGAPSKPGAAASSTPESLVKVLHESLSETQRKEVCFA